MSLMQKIINIIIERIEDIKTLKSSLKSLQRAYHQQEGTFSNLQRQRTKNMLDDTDARQNNRTKQQMALFEHIESLKLVTEKSKRCFIELSLRMFKTYDRHFQNQQALSNPNMSQIHLLYKSFLFKHADSAQNQYSLSFLRREIDSLNPFIYLGWVGEWSKNLFNEVSRTLHREMSNQKSKSLWKLLKDSIHQQQVEPIQVPIYSRQRLFGYCLAELESHYKMMNVLDLDTNYVKNIKRLGRKQQLSIRSIEQAIDKLIKRSHIKISSQIRKYQLLYGRYKNKLNLNKKIEHAVVSQSSTSTKHVKVSSSFFRKKNEALSRDKYRTIEQQSQNVRLACSANQMNSQVQFPLIEHPIKFDHLISKHHRFSKKFKTQQQEHDSAHYSHKDSELKGAKYKPLSIVVISSPQKVANGEKRYDNLCVHNSLRRHIKYNLHNYDKIKRRLNTDIGNILNKNVISFDDGNLGRQWNKGGFQSLSKPKHALFI